MRHQLRDQMMKLQNARPVLHVGRNRDVRFSAQRVVDEAGEVAARSGLHKNARAIPIHGLHGFAKPYRARPADRRQLTNLVGIFRIAPPGDAGVERHA